MQVRNILSSAIVALGTLTLASRAQIADIRENLDRRIGEISPSRNSERANIRPFTSDFAGPRGRSGRGPSGRILIQIILAGVEEAETYRGE